MINNNTLDKTNFFEALTNNEEKLTNPIENMHITENEEKQDSSSESNSTFIETTTNVATVATETLKNSERKENNTKTEAPADTVVSNKELETEPKRRLVKIENQSEYNAFFSIRTTTSKININPEITYPAVEPTKKTFIYQFPEGSRVHLDRGMTALIVTTHSELLLSAYSIINDTNENDDENENVTPIWLSRKVQCPDDKVTHLYIRTRYK